MKNSILRDSNDLNSTASISDCPVDFEILLFAFDQWGVELGKIISKDIYEKLTSTDEESDELDSSTKNLINLIKRSKPDK